MWWEWAWAWLTITIACFWALDIYTLIQNNRKKKGEEKDKPGRVGKEQGRDRHTCAEQVTDSEDEG